MKITIGKFTTPRHSHISDDHRNSDCKICGFADVWLDGVYIAELHRSPVGEYDVTFAAHIQVREGKIGGFATVAQACAAVVEQLRAAIIERMRVAP